MDPLRILMWINADPTFEAYETLDGIFSFHRQRGRAVVCIERIAFSHSALQSRICVKSCSARNEPVLSALPLSADIAEHNR